MFDRLNVERTREASREEYMKHLQFFIRKVIYPSCVIFTFSWILICGMIDALADIVNINFISGLLCYFIALAIAASNLILSSEKVSPIGRYFLHMLFSIVSISVVVAVFSMGFKTKYVFTGNSFYLVLLLIVCYLLIATPLIVWYFRKKSSSAK